MAQSKSDKVLAEMFRDIDRGLAKGGMHLEKNGNVHTVTRTKKKPKTEPKKKKK